MIREGSGHRARLVLLKVLNLLEEGYESLRIIAGAIHILESEIIGLGFKLARKFEESHRDCDVGGFVDAITGPAPL